MKLIPSSNEGQQKAQLHKDQNRSWGGKLDVTDEINAKLFSFFFV